MIGSLLMKFLLTTTLLVSFVGVAVFGFSGIHYSDSQNHGGGCVFAASQGVDCPTQGSSVGYLTFHLDAFKGFSTAIFGESVMSLLLLVLASLFFIGRVCFVHSLFWPPKFALYRYRSKGSFPLPQTQELTRWLALHENSPTTS